MSESTQTLVIFVLLNVIVYLLGGPFAAVATGSVMLFAMAVGSLEYKRGRIDQEAIDDEKTGRKLLAKQLDNERMALAARGIDARNHHEVTVPQKVVVK